MPFLDYTCPECDSELDVSAPDGAYCPTCKEWYDEYQISVWTDAIIKKNDLEAEQEWLAEQGEDDPDLEDPDQDD